VCTISFFVSEGANLSTMSSSCIPGPSSFWWWSIYSTVHNFPWFKFSWWRSSCAMPLLYSGSSLYRQPTPCVVHNFPEECTAGHFPAGGSQLLPGSTISSGHFLWLSASPCS
jgi:hypothetical protein